MTSLFQHWPERRLSALSAKLNEVCYLLGDGFNQPPEDSDYEFWGACSSICNGRPMCAPLLAVDSSELCEAVHEELEVLDVTEIGRDDDGSWLFLGETAAVESTLALNMLGIRGIVLITDDDSTLTNVALTSGLPTHPVTPAAELGEQLEALIVFMNSIDGACLVCSSTAINSLAAAVCAAAVAAEDKMSAARAIERVEKRRGPLCIDDDDYICLHRFCCRLTPPPPPKLPPLDAEGAAATEQPLTIDVTTPKTAPVIAGDKRGASTFQLPSPPGKKVKDAHAAGLGLGKEGGVKVLAAEASRAPALQAARVPRRPSKEEIVSGPPTKEPPTKPTEDAGLDEEPAHVWAPPSWRMADPDSRRQVGCGDTNF